MSHSHKYNTGADKLGITSAIICAVHCLVIPAIFLIKFSLTDGMNAATGSHIWGSGLPYWWETIDYVFLVIGFVAVYHASGHSPIRGVKISLWFFWLCLAIAVVFESKLHWMAYIASAGLVFTHFINIRKHKYYKPKVKKENNDL